MSLSKRDKILDFYEGVLRSVNVESDSEGLLTFNPGGMKVPSTVNDKRLVLPTKTVLENANWGEMVAFHPLGEDVYRGVSPVLNKLVDLMNFKLTSTISLLVTELTDIAVSKDYHSKLTPKQAEILTVLNKADKKTHSDFTKLIDKASPSGDNRLSSIYLKRGGTLKGDEFSRVAVVSFPFTQLMDEEDKTIFGMKLRVKDFNLFLNLFEYLLPNFEDQDHYSYGSRSRQAPYFESLITAFERVAKVLNKKTKLFKKHIEVYDDAYIDLSYSEYIEQIPELMGLIPNLDGNEGEASVEDKKNNVVEDEEPAAFTGQERVSKMAAQMENESHYQNTQQGHVQPPPHPSSSQRPPWEDEDDNGDAMDFHSASTGMEAPQQPQPRQPMPEYGYPQQPMPDYGYPQQPMPPGYGPPPQQMGGYPPQPMPPGYGPPPMGGYQQPNDPVSARERVRQRNQMEMYGGYPMYPNGVG